jgi:hypothetical protein
MSAPLGPPQGSGQASRDSSGTRPAAGADLADWQAFASP